MTMTPISMHTIFTTTPFNHIYLANHHPFMQLLIGSETSSRTTHCPVPTPTSWTQALRPGQPQALPLCLQFHFSAVVWQRRLLECITKGCQEFERIRFLGDACLTLAPTLTACTMPDQTLALARVANPPQKCKQKISQQKKRANNTLHLCGQSS